MRRVIGRAASDLLRRSPGCSPPSTAGLTTESLWQTSTLCRAVRQQAESWTQQRNMHSGSSISSSVLRLLPTSLLEAPMLSHAFNSTVKASSQSTWVGSRVSSRSTAVSRAMNSAGLIRTGLVHSNTAGARIGTSLASNGRGFVCTSLGSRMAAAAQPSGPARQAVAALKARKIGETSARPANLQWRGFAAGAAKAGENPSGRRRAMMASAENKSSSQALYLVS